MSTSACVHLKICISGEAGNGYETEKKDYPIQSNFSQTHKIGSNDNIGIRAFYYVKTKKSSNKMLPQWALNQGPQPFVSDALLSLSHWGMCYLGYP